MLVDDSAILLSEAVPFLNRHPGLEIVGTVSKAANAVTHAQMLMPDVVLLDITVPGMQGLPLIPQLHVINPALRVIVLDEIDIDSVKHTALTQGAAAFIAKQNAKRQLLPAILARGTV